jgi:hypothetical protein
MRPEMIIAMVILFGIAFHETCPVVDRELTLKAIPQWIKPNIFEKVQCLFKERMEQNEYKELVTHYNKTYGTKFSFD